MYISLHILLIGVKQETDRHRHAYVTCYHFFRDILTCLIDNGSKLSLHLDRNIQRISMPMQQAVARL
jgi:hypothetical protein